MSLYSNKHRLRAGRSRKTGFALIFVITVMALLLTFLIAAQGSVMTSIRTAHRGNDRMAEAEKLAISLAETQHRLEIELHNNKSYQGIKYGTGDELLVLTAGDPIYPTLPGITYRQGDALLTLVEKPAKGSAAPEQKRQYLINGSRMRIGAIRVSG